ncbi:hypothetical protein [Candidatus Frankia nodulisporulans]|uniref:hypothetical protein n=1 Tax=Candidatus Frankia nodulisporulans TaxID=2060052 RepID=UPI0013D48FEF|nr:hypothetical protein [Candidatus Frankia nodulisporulans]
MIWMWEAKAAPGQLTRLRDWAVDALGDRDGEVYLSHQRAGDLVVVIIRTTAPPMPTVPPGLTTGAPHVWPFEQVHPPAAPSDRGHAR